MNYTEAVKYLKRAEKSGYIRYHSGIAAFETTKYNGKVKTNYGINIDGDGGIHEDGRHLFGCPQIIWDAEDAERMFPARKKQVLPVTSQE